MRSPCSFALMAYITNPGSGARMDAPGKSQAMAIREISSSEPLPSMIPNPSGIPICAASALRKSLIRSPG